MKTTKQLALVLCLAVLGTAIEARADCRYVRGSLTETIIPSPNDPFGRVLGNVNGVLNGTSTAVITSRNPPNATSYDVFVTKGGDMLTATGVITTTPIAGTPPGEVTAIVILTVTGGSGKYADATGMITFEGQGHNLVGGPGVGTFDLIYQGLICGPSVKAKEK